MNLANYFDNVEGIGILGTADPTGKVDLAIYARPHIIDDQTVAFLMRNHLSHDNIKANPHAAYLFLERAQGYKGLRIYLTRTWEETDAGKIETLRRKKRTDEGVEATPVFIVHFKVDEVRPLVGSAATAV